MRELYVRRWGAGERLAVLVHGISADSGGWWRLGPELARRGYRVHAPDLPGHGESPHWARYTYEEMADALVDAVPERPDLVIGHSLGGRLVAMAADRIRPGRTIYEDPAWSAGGADTARAFAARKGLTAEQVRQASPRWPAPAHQATTAALASWDPATADLIRGQGVCEPAPAVPPALVVLADPSPVVSPETADRLARDGFVVRTVPGAGHVIHNDDFDGFLAAAGDHL